MNNRKVLFVLCFCTLAACTDVNSSRGTITILNDELLRAYQNADSSLTVKRSKLLFSNDKEANDCKSYFAFSTKYELGESVYNQQVKSEYLICDALNIVMGSTGGLAEMRQSMDYGEKLISRLDLRTFPSSLNRAASDTAYTLKSLYPNQTSFAGNVAEYQDEDWALSMEVVAVARINGNSAPDWVVWVSDESKSGNYRGYSTIIVYDPGEKETISATVYP